MLVFPWWIFFWHVKIVAMDSSNTGYFTSNDFSQILWLFIDTKHRAGRHKKDGYFKQSEGMTQVFWNVHCLLMPSNTKCCCLNCRFSSRLMLIIMAQFMKRNLTQWRIRYQSTHTLFSLSLFSLSSPHYFIFLHNSLHDRKI